MDQTKQANEIGALILDKKDNVAVALADLEAGKECLVMEEGGGKYFLTLTEAVPFGHKLALVDLAGDEAVYKYGEEIGRMRVAAGKGSWIHSHNLYCERGGMK